MRFTSWSCSTATSAVFFLPQLVAFPLYLPQPLGQFLELFAQSHESLMALYILLSLFKFFGAGQTLAHGFSSFSAGQHVVGASGNGLIPIFVVDFEELLVDGSSPYRAHRAYLFQDGIPALLELLY